MENKDFKPPKSAMAYYVKLYCKRRDASLCKLKSVHEEAVKSWLLLSKSERQHFVRKYKKCVTNYQTKFAMYLKSIEPYMKKKPIPKSIITDDLPVSDLKEDNNINQSQSATEPEPIDEAVSVGGAHERIDTDLTSENGTVDELPEDVIRLPEPTPPGLKNAKELFEAINLKDPQANTDWSNLSRIKKQRFIAAYHALNQEYIQNYEQYLESLPSQELYQLYIQNTRSQEENMD